MSWNNVLPPHLLFPELRKKRLEPGTLAFMIRKKDGKPWKLIEIHEWNNGQAGFYKAHNIHAKGRHTKYGYLFAWDHELQPLPEETKGKGEELRAYTLEELALIYGPEGK